MGACSFNNGRMQPQLWAQAALRRLRAPEIGVRETGHSLAAVCVGDHAHVRRVGPAHHVRHPRVQERRLVLAQARLARGARVRLGVRVTRALRMAYGS